MTALSERPDGAVVGEQLSHESADLHVTGHALYTDDLVARTRDCLHAHPVQSPHAHARVTGLRVDAAYDVPGVVRVLTADDVPGVNDSGTKHDEPLFPSEVMFVGHAVCWVLGETLEAARLGAAAVEVDYEPLPSIISVRDAIAAESFQGGQPTVERGDVDAAFASAAHVFSGETEMAGQEHFYLETHASLALVDEAGQVFVQSSTQHPTETQEIVAHVLGLDSHAVTVQCLRMGGGFGGKEMQPHGFAAVAALMCVYVALVGGVGAGFVALAIGLFNSIMFPVIFTLSLERSSAGEEATSGLLCTAIVGGALVPLLVGKVSELTSYHTALIVPACCYAIICAFALRAQHAALFAHREQDQWPSSAI